MRTSVVGVSGVVLTAALVAYCFDVAESRTTPSAAPRLVTIELDVRVHPASTPPLTKVGVDRITSDASALLQTVKYSGDVACDVKIVTKSFAPFLIGDGIVNSKAAYDALFPERRLGPLPVSLGRRWQVRVVKEISWCSTYVPAGGCADVNGRRIAVARHLVPVEGILWAHELGHTQGLLHRSDDYVALMWPSILDDHNLVNESECHAFKK